MKIYIDIQDCGVVVSGNAKDKIGDMSVMNGVVLIYGTVAV